MKKLLLFAALVILASCEKKSESGCWDCIIKQSDGIEYAATYCCTEQEIVLIANGQAVNGTKVTCGKQ